MIPLEFLGKGMTLTLPIIASGFVFTALSLLALSAQAGGQSVMLDNGEQVVAFMALDIPEALRNPECEKYVFKNNAFEPLPDGKYASDGDSFLARQSCLYPMTGRAALSTGTIVEFFQEDTFNTNGNLAFSVTNGQYIPLEDGSYKLNNGQDFKIVDGHIDEYGAFENDTIIFEDHN